MTNEECLKKVLVLIGAYVPGFKAGGPIRSIANLTAGLRTEGFSFYVLTLNRDFKERAVYDVPTNQWTPIGNAQVWYATSFSLASTRQIIRDLKPEIVYLNGFFSHWTFGVLLLRWLGLLPPLAIVLATRGEFSSGALSLKKVRKKAFLKLMSVWGLYRKVLWHASTVREKEDIQRVMVRFPIGVKKLTRAVSAIHVAAPIQVASDLPDQLEGGPAAGTLAKKRGRASFVFVSRISPMKNVPQAIAILSRVKGEVTYDIYGPAEDPECLAECRRLIAAAPGNVKVKIMGALPHAEAVKKFSEYHFFLFPTLGENFGHVIAESLSAGCPVVLSDQTPWTDLAQKGIGWDLPLSDEQEWDRVLQHCVDMDNGQYSSMSAAARRFFEQWAYGGAIRQENVALLERSLTLNSSQHSDHTSSAPMENVNDR